MSWSVGYDENWQRDIGYGVPSNCDFPGCRAVIHRGLAYVCCDERPYGGPKGCGLFFCGKHRGYGCSHAGMTPTPDRREWMRHKLRDPSWQPWREQNPALVDSIKEALRKGRRP